MKKRLIWTCNRAWTIGSESRTEGPCSGLFTIPTLPSMFLSLKSGWPILFLSLSPTQSAYQTLGHWHPNLSHSWNRGSAAMALRSPLLPLPLSISLSLSLSIWDPSPKPSLNDSKRKPTPTRLKRTGQNCPSNPTLISAQTSRLCCKYREIEWLPDKPYGQNYPLNFWELPTQPVPFWLVLL